MCDTLISRVYFTQSILHTEIQINDNERCLKNLNQFKKSQTNEKI